MLAAPRSAVRPDGTMLVLDAESRLRARRARVLRKDETTAYVEGAPGETLRVVISPVETFVDGMPVQVLEPEAKPATIPVSAPQEGAK